MSSASRLIPLVVVAVVLTFASPVWAKAPTLEELPTAKFINEKSKKEILARALAEAEAKKDPKMDKINAFADPVGSIYQWEPIVDIFNDDKEDMKYREAAALAIRAKFRGIESDARVRELKKKIGLAVVKQLMNRDVTIRTLAYGILVEFFPGQVNRLKYDPNESNFMRRSKAAKDWRNHLQK